MASMLLAKSLGISDVAEYKTAKQIKILCQEHGIHNPSTHAAKHLKKEPYSELEVCFSLSKKLWYRYDNSLLHHSTETGMCYLICL